MFKAYIMNITNFKLVFYPYTVTVDGVLTATGWTFRWIRLHVGYERKITA